MIEFLHSFQPSPVLFQLYWLKIHWYGFLIAIGALLGFLVVLLLAHQYKIKKDHIYNLAFYVIIFGLIGDRLYYVFYAWEYYSQNLLDIFKIWQGGLAIHGAMIAGLLVIFIYSKKHKLNPWQITDLVVMALVLAMSIGRWGNYFNMELFGWPTDLSWGIPIDQSHRPLEFQNQTYFHPSFLYESIYNLLVFTVLFIWHQLRINKNKINPNKNHGFGLITLAYLILYSIGRFTNEFIRIDYSPYVFGLRWAQIFSLFIIIVCLTIITYKLAKRFTKT